MRIRWIKAGLVVAAATMFAMFLMMPVGAWTRVDEDTAATYKAKCASCHGAKAEKKFDATKSDDELVQITLKGKQAEKPPHMPGYEAKGMTTEQAKALVAYMKSLK